MDCPFFVQLNERSHPMEQILYKEYIQKKRMHMVRLQLLWR